MPRRAGRRRSTMKTHSVDVCCHFTYAHIMHHVDVAISLSFCLCIRIASRTMQKRCNATIFCHFAYAYVLHQQKCTNSYVCKCKFLLNSTNVLSINRLTPCDPRFIFNFITLFSGANPRCFSVHLAFALLHP